VTCSLTIVGLGYVGLPLAQGACLGGMRVVGLDTDSSVVSGLSNGVSHIDDIDSVDLAAMAEAGFLAPTTQVVSVAPTLSSFVSQPHWTTTEHLT